MKKIHKIDSIDKTTWDYMQDNKELIETHNVLVNTNLDTITDIHSGNPETSWENSQLAMQL